MRHQGDRAVALRTAFSRFARSGKRTAEVTRRAGREQANIVDRTKSANHQISFENPGGGAEQVAGKSFSRLEELGWRNAVAIVKLRRLYVTGWEYRKLLLTGQNPRSNANLL